MPARNDEAETESAVQLVVPDQKSDDTWKNNSVAMEVAESLKTPLSLSLNKDSLQIIKNNEMLRDEIIDSTVYLAQKLSYFKTQKCSLSQFHFASVEFSSKCQYFQIHQLQSKLHYVLSHFFSPDTVHIYDSLPSTPYIVGSDLQRQLKELYPNVTNFSLMPSPKQNNGVDCGVFAIANLVNLMSGNALASNMKYSDDARDTLVKILEEDTVLCATSFPLTAVRGRKKVPEKMKFDPVCVGVKNLKKLEFLDSCPTKGAPKHKKQRRYEGRFNN